MICVNAILYPIQLDPVNVKNPEVASMTTSLKYGEEMYIDMCLNNFFQFI
jgi:hypothetical protein